MVACLALLGALVIGGTADAKKKKKKSATVTATRAFPTVAPQHATGTPRVLVSIPLTIGKKAKGKIVDSEAPKITYTATGSPGPLENLELRLTAPNGRTVGLANPADGVDDTVVGPFTLSANSPFGVCQVTAADPPPPPPCVDPENVLLAPYAGEAGDPGLAWFSGIGAKGTWTLKIINASTTEPVTLVSAKLSGATASKFK